jgi:hypothetical protein
MLPKSALAASWVVVHPICANCFQSGCDGTPIVMMLQVIEQMQCRDRT